MTEFDYETFISRNDFFISDLLQDKIKNTSLVFAGCGLSSILIEMAARIGFGKFVLCDADKVELSNLNRQGFYLGDSGKSKVKVLQDKIANINPDAEIITIDQKISDCTGIDRLISYGDIIINTIDCGQLYFDLVHRSMDSNKLVICPFNPGFGGLVVCFNKDSGTVHELLKSDNIEEGLEFSRKLIANNEAIAIPKIMREQLDENLNTIIGKGYEPQISIGVHMSSSIALACIVKYLNNEEIPYCPKLIYRGLYNLQDES